MMTIQRIVSILTIAWAGGWMSYSAMAEEASAVEEDSSDAKEWSTEEEKYLYYMKEYKAGTHPTRKLRNEVNENGTAMVALSRIPLSDEEKAACEKIKAKVAERLATWEEENKDAIAEAYAMMGKGRQANDYQLYDKWHKVKIKLSQSRPRGKIDDFLDVLSEESIAAYKKEADRMRFWYVGHGHNEQILDLMKLGLPLQEAKKVEKQYVVASKNQKKKKMTGDAEGGGKLLWGAFLANYKKEHGLTKQMDIPDYQEFEDQPEREWNYEINGQPGSIKAKLKKIDSGKLQLQAFGGKRGEIPLDAFSDADRKYLNEALAALAKDEEEEK